MPEHSKPVCFIREEKDPAKTFIHNEMHDIDISVKLFAKWKCFLNKKEMCNI